MDRVTLYLYDFKFKFMFMNNKTTVNNILTEYCAFIIIIHAVNSIILVISLHYLIFKQYLYVKENVDIS